MIPIVGKDKKCSIELLRFRIHMRWWIRRIAISVVNARNLSIFYLRSPMPGLDNELVLCLNISEDNDFDIRVGKRHHFANSRHPAADQAIKAVVDRVAANLGNVLVGMIRASITTRINGLSIFRLDRSYKRVP